MMGGQLVNRVERNGKGWKQEKGEKRILFVFEFLVDYAFLLRGLSRICLSLNDVMIDMPRNLPHVVKR